MTFDPTLIDQATKFLEKAKAAKVTVSVAESCTGGLISALLTEIPGSSQVVDRGFVTYTNASKNEMLGVPINLIDENGAVSREVAKHMAIGALERSNATIAVSVTGIAGPGSDSFKPAGLVYFALAINGQETKTDKQKFGDCGRNNVRVKSVRHALQMLSEGVDLV